MSIGVAAMETAAMVVAAIVVGTGLMQNFIQMAQLGLAAGALMRRPPAARFALIWQRYADVALPISLLVPAYNEEKSIEDSVRSLLAVGYPHFEVIVVNDGSSDRTLTQLRTKFGLEPAARPHDEILGHKPVHAVYTSAREPRLVVIDKENGGKADALNCAINYARSPLVCAIDADSLLEQDSLLRAVRPFIDDPERTVAVGATVRVANGCRIERGHVLEVGLAKGPLALLQTIEYLRAFLMGRLAWSQIGILTIVSGAFGLFRRKIVIDAGGYSTDTVGEDLELVIKIHRLMRERQRDYCIQFIPEPVCWTEVPVTLRMLGNQRARWHRGALETFFKHWDMLLKPRFGRISFGMLNMLMVDVIGPVVEVLGYILVPVLWLLGLLSIDYLLAFLAVTFTFGIAISVGALVLEELELRRYPHARDIAILFVVAILENFGYRQLNNFWRLRGLWQYLRGEQGWGAVKRHGFSPAAAQTREGITISPKHRLPPPSLPALAASEPILLAEVLRAPPPH